MSEAEYLKRYRDDRDGMYDGWTSSTGIDDDASWVDIDSYQRLMQQLREKEARIARLESVIGYYVADLLNNGFTSKTVNAMKDVINESPQQSLAHIRADAVEQAIKDLDITAFAVIGRGAVISESSLYRYAQHLREADKQEK